MPTYLSIDQKRQLAERMWQYLKKTDHSKAALLTGFVEKFGRNEGYMAQKLDGTVSTLSEPESDWIIENAWGMLTVRKIKECFQELFQSTPQHYQFYVPPDPFSLSPFEAFKYGLGRVVREKKAFRTYQ